MLSAAEVELAGLYINAYTAIEFRHIVEEMGHPQPSTLMQTDNSKSRGNYQQQKCSISQRQFRFFWRPGATNYADY